jgi:hypothetical protein
VFITVFVFKPSSKTKKYEMRMKEEQQKDEMQQKAGTKPGLCRQARAWCCDKNKQKNLRIIKIEKKNSSKNPNAKQTRKQISRKKDCAYYILQLIFIKLQFRYICFICGCMF